MTRRLIWWCQCLRCWGVEKKYLIARAAGISAQLPGSYSTENRLFVVTWGVHSPLRRRVTGSAPSEKVVSWGVALKSSEVRRGFPLSARERITYSFSSKTMNLFDWGNLQCKSKGRAECLSARAFHDIREYHASPSLFHKQFGGALCPFPKGIAKNSSSILWYLVKCSIWHFCAEQ